MSRRHRIAARITRKAAKIGHRLFTISIGLFAAFLIFLAG